MLWVPFAKFAGIIHDVAGNGDVSVTVFAQVVNQGRRHHAGPDQEDLVGVSLYHLEIRTLTSNKI